MSARVLAPRCLFVLALVAAVVATPGAAQTVYPKGTTIWDQAAAMPGWRVFPAPNGEVVVIDLDGTVHHTWSSPLPGEELVFGEPIPGTEGHVFAMSRPIGGGFFSMDTALELDWDGNVVWSYDAVAPMISLHHDIERLPDGTTMILANTDVFVPPFMIDVIDDNVIEVDEFGNVLWDWVTTDHMNELGFTPESQAMIADYPHGGDWAHANSATRIPANDHVDPAFAEGNVIVSYRSTNIVLIIDRQTDAVVWQLGPYEPLTTGQHHAHMIPQGRPGAGNILIYDNGSATGYPIESFGRAYTRIIEVDPVTKDIVWSYDGSDSGTTKREFYADIVGSAQRLPNGNTLTLDGVRGRFFEIDTDGNIVWEHLHESTHPPVEGVPVSRITYRVYWMPYAWAPEDRELPAQPLEPAKKRWHPGPF